MARRGASGEDRTRENTRSRGARRAGTVSVEPARARWCFGCPVVSPALFGLVHCDGAEYARLMAAIEAVQLRGGPCDGDRPNPIPDSEFPDSLTAITVMDHAAWVGHVYGVTLESIVDETGVRRRVFDFERTVDADTVKAGAATGPPT
jgi:hypothetical protein